LEFADRAAALTRDVDDGSTRMFVQGNLGLAALLNGKINAAQAALREELTLCHELVTPLYAAEALLGLAAVAAHHGQLDRAARLIGAARAQANDEVQTELEGQLEAPFFATARARCGSDAWASARRDGLALSFEDAVSLGLEDESPGVTGARQSLV
jgi:3-oxoacyl-ACP reductase-like protein